MGKKYYSETRDVEIVVSYIDQEHQAALSQYPYHKSASLKLAELTASSSTKFKLADFLVYAMFRRLGTTPDRYKNLETIRDNIKTFDEEFEDYFDVTQGTLRHRPNTSPTTELTESVGVAVGLLVISKLHGFILADWALIPVLQHKHLDFEWACDSQQVVQVEVKGTIAQDNKLKSGAGSGSTAGHKSNIKEKKEELEKRRVNNEDEYAALIRYGTIASVDSVSGVRCWVLDPPAVDIAGNRRYLRILKRLSFVSSVITLLAPYSELARALNTRLQKLIGTPNEIRDLGPLELRRPLVDSVTGARASFISNRRRAWIINRDFNFEGVLIRTPTNTGDERSDGKAKRGIVVALDPRLIDIAVSQNFEALLEYRMEANTFISVPIFRSAKRQATFFETDLLISSSGLVVGIERIPRDRR